MLFVFFETPNRIPYFVIVCWVFFEFLRHDSSLFLRLFLIFRNFARGDPTTGFTDVNFIVGGGEQARKVEGNCLGGVEGRYKRGRGYGEKTEEVQV